MPKTYWWSCTSCRKFWWIDNSRVHNTWRKLWISKKSPICLIGANLATQWIQSFPCNKKKNFTRKRKDLAKLLGTNQKTKSYLLWQFLGMRGQAAVRNLSERTCANVHYADEKWRIAKNESRVERDEDRSFRRKNIKKKRNWKNDRGDVCRL